MLDYIEYWMNQKNNSNDETYKKNIFLKEQTWETYYLVILWCNIIILKFESVFALFFSSILWENRLTNKDNIAHSNNIKFDKTGAFISSEILILKPNTLNQYELSIQYYHFNIIIIWRMNIITFFVKRTFTAEVYANIPWQYYWSHKFIIYCNSILSTYLYN